MTFHLRRYVFYSLWSGRKLDVLYCSYTEQPFVYLTQLIVSLLHLDANTYMKTASPFFKQKSLVL